MCSRNKRNGSPTDGLWMAAALLGMLFGLAMALTALCLQRKNRQYRDALIELSEQLPDEDEPDAAKRREEWRSSQAPPHKTAEERSADRRIREEA